MLDEMPISVAAKRSARFAARRMRASVLEAIYTCTINVAKDMAALRA
jgi:hypothetical protein